MTTPLVCHVDGRRDPEIFLCGVCNVPICSLHEPAPSGRHLPEDHKSKEKEPMTRAAEKDDDQKALLEDDGDAEEGTPSGKVSRRLRLTIVPMRGKKLGITVVDARTEMNEAETIIGPTRQRTDSWSVDSAPEAFNLVLKNFLKSVKTENQASLFADEKRGKPKVSK